MTIYLWTLCFVLFSKAQHKMHGPSHPSSLFILTRLKGRILFFFFSLSPSGEQIYIVKVFRLTWVYAEMDLRSWQFQMVSPPIPPHVPERGCFSGGREVCVKIHLRLWQLNQMPTHNHEHPLRSENPSEATISLCNDHSLLHLAACLSPNTCSRWDSEARGTRVETLARAEVVKSNSGVGCPDPNIGAPACSPVSHWQVGDCCSRNWKCCRVLFTPPHTIFPHFRTYFHWGRVWWL